MIKHVLVPTDGSDFAAIGVKYAVKLAKQCQAKLQGLHVVDIRLLEGPILRDISASLGTVPYVNYQGNIAMILEERGAAALKAFEAECQEAGVECEVVQETGVIARCIIARSELCDLIVMGRGGEHNEWLDGLVGSTTSAVVRKSDRPVLITGTDRFETEKLVIAYDGSAHAKRALQTAAEIAAEWTMAAHVLVVGGENDYHLLDEARAYLDSYNLQSHYELRGGDPSETIVDYAAETGADLLGMGAYGHTKVRELVVGSTTVYALNHAPCPLLLLR